MSDIERVDEGDHRGSFVIEKDGQRLAEMTYTGAGEKKVIIDHTWVDDSLRGQGIARKLLDALVAWARETGTRAIPICPYASAQFEKDPSIRDILAA
jgi:uncharacterized protein